MGLVIEYDNKINVGDGENSYYNNSIVKESIKKIDGEIKIAFL